MFKLPAGVEFRAAVAEGAALDLLDQGIDLPGKPDGSFPVLPADITDISDQHLMKLMELLRQWCDYFDIQLASAQVTEQAWLSSALVDAAGAKNVTITKARAEVDERYQRAMSYRKLVESQAKRAERGYYHCSRELSRRTQPRRPEKPREYGWGADGKGHLS